MLYISETDMTEICFSWNDTIDIIDETLESIEFGDYSQPLKPYLRFGNQLNRIIAMPAYVGGKIKRAGIKWISSFPKNTEQKMPRASSVTILNDILTGMPLAIFNTPKISIIRTASVSGYVIKKYCEYKIKKQYNIGIIGWGPIGQYHCRMCKEILKEALGNIYIYDIRDIEILDNNITICKSWQEVYEKADIFITCTSTLERYIDLPAHGSKLIMDISLRDFKKEALDCFAKPFIIDDWNEVNRENTDIEYYSKVKKFGEQDTISLCNIKKRNMNSIYSEESIVFFAPMGMGVFDIAIANYFYNKAIVNGFGKFME